MKWHLRSVLDGISSHPILWLFLSVPPSTPSSVYRTYSESWLDTVELRFLRKPEKMDNMLRLFFLLSDWAWWRDDNWLEGRETRRKKGAEKKKNGDNKRDRTGVTVSEQFFCFRPNCMQHTTHEKDPYDINRQQKASLCCLSEPFYALLVSIRHRVKHHKCLWTIVAKDAKTLWLEHLWSFYNLSWCLRFLCTEVTHCYTITVCQVVLSVYCDIQ